MFYLFHGDDEFTAREQVKKVREAGKFEYNQDNYDGAETDLTTIITTADTMPFLTEQRLVFVEGLPKRKRGETSDAPTKAAEPAATTTTTTKGKKGKKSKPTTLTRAGFEKALAEYIPTMPDSTVLLMLIDEPLDSTNTLVKTAEKYGKVVQCTLPKGAALESWIGKRVKNNGVKISAEANTLLSNFIGNNLRLLSNEIDKLSAYVGEGKTIGSDDVRKLSVSVQEARVFDLTDALAQRNRKNALNILHDLLSDGEPPIKLIFTITSQVRTLLLVKELAQKGMRSPVIASTLGMPPFIVEKAMRQVGNFSLPQLEETYRQLLATDAALKRSRIEPEMALDLLIVSFGVA